MAVVLKRERDGKRYRKWWYGEYTECGRRKVVTLDVPWAGNPPASESLRDAGDEKFEASRRMAQKALEGFQAKAALKGRAEHLTERLIEAKTGRRVEHVRIVDLAERWKANRVDELTPAYEKGVESACKRFVEYMAERRSKAVYLYEVTPDDAMGFFRKLRESLAPRTAHGYAALIRSACARYLPEGTVNPFRDITLKGEKDSIHRKPFSPEELRKILDTARDDPFMYPLIVTAACTGMRRGDICRLQWDAIDRKSGMVRARASKTGEPVEIPIFGPLQAVLDGMEGQQDGWVFPEAADMLERNPHGLTYRFKAILAKALDPALLKETEALPVAGDIEKPGLEAIQAQVKAGPRRDRMEDTFRRYCAGESLGAIEKATGRSRGQTSGDLHAIEKWLGTPFVRNVRRPSVKAAIERTTRQARGVGKGTLAASVRDWHALRTTFVTLALSAGVPVELVRRVTGHRTVEIVMENYFRPGREQFRAALTGALPDVLTGGVKSPREEVLEICQQATARSWKQDMARIAKLVGGM